MEVTAGEEIAADSIVYVNRADGKAYVADTTMANDVRADGIALEDIAPDEVGSMQRSGSYPTTGLAPPATYYLGAAGTLSASRSGVRVGYAVSATELHIDIVQDDRDAVGTVKAYLKDLEGIPANNLTAFWVECSGQTLEDPESPLHGRNIPDLNGQGRFLRGSAKSGATGGYEMVNGTTGTDDSSESNGGRGSSPSQVSLHGHSHALSFDNRPPYYDVVWIMKVK